MTALALNAQTPTFDRAINMGGINFDKSHDITVDAYGNVYATGIMVSIG